MGSHRDSWIYGAGDALSGTICMMEVARVLGEMYDGVSGTENILGQKKETEFSNK